MRASLSHSRRNSRDASRVRHSARYGAQTMIKVCVLHGPNLNLLGIREPDVYGQETFDEMNRKIKNRARELEMEARIFQLNSEGEIIGAIHEALHWAGCLIINPGAYPHYSYEIRDTLAAVRLPTIESH